MNDNQPLADAKPCPFCKGAKLAIMKYAFMEWYILCIDCDAHGPNEIDAQTAVDAWNQRAEMGVTPGPPNNAVSG